ncbi:MAG TPA: 30S ribosomal protein S21 [Bacteriovoracaceae bacterium]|nr:30S ribosomal protein S21 [Bacteriovoracaceae bacterium]
MGYEKNNSKDKIRIDITDGFAVERALKKFKRLCDAYGIVKEYRAREYYSKPSVKQKEKLEAADKRRKKTSSKSMGRGTKKI